MAYEERIYLFILLFVFFFVVANLTFRLPWQPVSLDKIHMLGRGLPKEHFCKTFVKISAVRCSSKFPIISQWQP